LEEEERLEQERLERETPTDFDLYTLTDEYAAQETQYWSRKLKRGRLIQAVEAKDIATIDRLTDNDPELKRLAFRLLTRKHGPGREKGEPRPTLDIPEKVREALAEAAADIPRIKRICQENGIRYRREDAIDIAALGHGVDPQQLRNYLKNQN
jgi:hypothetical protein